MLCLAGLATTPTGQASGPLAYPGPLLLSDLSQSVLTCVLTRHVKASLDTAVTRTVAVHRTRWARGLLRSRKYGLVED